MATKSSSLAAQVLVQSIQRAVVSARINGEEFLGNMGNPIPPGSCK